MKIFVKFIEVKHQKDESVTCQKNKNIIEISREIHFHSHISDEMIHIDLTECTSCVFSCRRIAKF